MALTFETRQRLKLLVSEARKAEYARAKAQAKHGTRLAEVRLNDKAEEHYADCECGWWGGPYARLSTAAGSLARHRIASHS